jgi:hypothetical protein
VPRNSLRAGALRSNRRGKHEDEARWRAPTPGCAPRRRRNRRCRVPPVAKSWLEGFTPSTTGAAAKTVQDAMQARRPIDQWVSVRVLCCRMRRGAALVARRARAAQGPGRGRSLDELAQWFDLSPTGMLVYDDSGLIVLRSNPAFEALVGHVPVLLQRGLGRAAGAAGLAATARRGGAAPGRAAAGARAVVPLARGRRRT